MLIGEQKKVAQSSSLENLSHKAAVTLVLSGP